MRNWLKAYWHQPWDRKTLYLATALSLIPILLHLVFQKGQMREQSSPSRPLGGLDTHIPRGFVLVPIDVQNFEALDSVFGKFGFVDLYVPAQEGQSARLMARQVRLLRAPQNPSQFAILVEERHVEKVLAKGGLFTVVVKPTNPDGTEFVNTGDGERRPKRKIHYEENK